MVVVLVAAPVGLSEPGAGPPVGRVPGAVDASVLPGAEQDTPTQRPPLLRVLVPSSHEPGDSIEVSLRPDLTVVFRVRLSTTGGIGTSIRSVVVPSQPESTEGGDGSRNVKSFV